VGIIVGLPGPFSLWIGGKAKFEAGCITFIFLVVPLFCVASIVWLLWAEVWLVIHLCYWCWLFVSWPFRLASRRQSQ
jgi:hypothetical protein